MQKCIIILFQVNISIEPEKNALSHARMSGCTYVLILTITQL